MNQPCNPIPLAAADIDAALGALSPRFDLRIVAECSSTNSLLVDDSPADDGRVHVVIAEHQTSGRGRRGKTWLSWPGASLTFSSLWRFPAGAPVPAGLSLVAGIAVARALEKQGATGVQLKWPNDVLLLGQKVAGILVELLPGRSGTPAAVIGIGINMALPAGERIPDQDGVADLASHVPTLPNRNRLTALLLRELHDLLETYASAGFPALRGAWQQRNAFAELPVRISGESTDLEGICAGVDEDGALLLRTDSGITRILSGEVSLRPLP